MKNQYKHWRDIPQKRAKRQPEKTFRLAANVWADPSRLQLAAK
jgi:hypothetical protein